MKPCPSPTSLERLLDGALEPPEAETIAEHITRCARCQAILERLSDDPELCGWLSDSRLEATPYGPELELARFLPAQPEQAPSELDSGTGNEVVSEDLSFLGPPRRVGDRGSLGPYLVEAVLGRGGMGVVLRAYDEGLQRPVAVKVLRPNLAHAEARQRFVQEARAAARVRHDHIVTVFAVANPAEGPPHFAMELLAGPSLAERIRQGHGLEPGQAAEWLAQAAEGLATAHAAGLIHRDVKPSNILIDPATGRAKVADFGLAWLSESSGAGERLTQHGTVLGTPAYMSPEQAQGMPDLDGRTDVYSLGMTLYEALTGELPFRGKPTAVLRQVLEEEPRAPRQFNGAVPRDLETICLKALAKDRASRYPTAATFAADLRRWQRGEPIQARRIGVVGRGWRWCRRRPLVASLLAALMLSLAGGLGGILWQWQRAEHEALVATRQRDRAMEVVDHYLLLTSEQRLFNEPGTQPLRKQLMQEAAKYYQELIADRPHEPGARFRYGGTLVRLAQTVYQIDGAAPALELAQQALRVQRGLVDEYFNEPAYRVLLADTLNVLGVCQDNLRQVTEAEAAYREILRLCESHTDPPSQRRRLMALLNLGKLLGENGQTVRAVEAQQQGIQIGTPLVERRLELPESRIFLARCHHNLAITYLHLGVLDKTVEHATQALALWDGTLAESPKDFQAQNMRARSLETLSECYLLRRQPDAAQEAITRALPMATQVAQQNPLVDEFQETPTLLRNNLGLSHQMAGRLSEAEAEFQEGLAHARKVARAAPKNLALGADPLLIHDNLANLYTEMGRLDEALDRYGQAAQELQDLLKRDPKLIRERYLLCDIYAHRAIAWMEYGRADEAVADWERARKADLGALPSLLLLARSLAEARQKGQDPQATFRTHYAAGMMELARLDPILIPFGSTFYIDSLICSQASLAVTQDERLAAADRAKRAEEYAVRAVNYLRRAQADGYFQRVPDRIARLTSDPELAPLRARADFQALLAEAEGKDQGR